MLFKVASECSRILNNHSCLSTCWYSLAGANVVQTLFDCLAIGGKKIQTKSRATKKKHLEVIQVG